MDSQFFIKIFNPYRGKYTVKLQYVHDRYLFDGYGNEWRTIYKPMKDFLIERAIRGVTIIGWFTNTRPNVLGIDIDDHDGYAWEGVKASPRLLSIYDNILKIFPLPSIVVQSPRGIHLYYILDDRIPTDILQYLAKLKLKNIPCEIRPTTDLSLRIPEEKRILNPKTLLPIIINNELVTYHPAFLFENEYLPGTLRQTLQERKCKLRSLKATAKLEQVEALYTPILPGQSNEALNNLIPIYKNAGLTEEESVYRMSMILQKSYLYKGELRKPKRLEQRVRSYYKRDIQKYVPKPKKLQLNLLHKPVVDTLIKKSPFAKQRKKPLEQFLYSILSWCDWHDDIIKDPFQTARFDYLYPYYRKNRKEGYYPLPYTFLKRVNGQYPSIMEWLSRIGVLKEAPYRYCPQNGICKYYKLHIKESCIVL